MGRNLANGSHRTVKFDRQAVNIVDVGVFQVFSIVVVGVFRVLGTVVSHHAAVKVDVRPVVVLIIIDAVTVDVVTTGHIPILLVVTRRGAVGYRHRRNAVRSAGRTCLIVVVHHVDIAAARTTIATIAAVINHTIAEIDVLRLHGVLPLILVVQHVARVPRPIVTCTVETRRTVSHVGNEIMVERSKFAAPDAAIAVSTLAVTRIHETLGNRTPLHGEVVVIVIRSHLVDTPRERAVVEDDARLVTLPCGIGTLVDILFLSTTEADETYDIVCTRANGIVTYSNTWIRRRLSEDGDVVLHGQVAGQGNDTCHVEHDDAVSLAHCVAERSRATVLQVCHVIDRTLTSTRYVAAVTLCTGKCRCPRLGHRHHRCHRCTQR